MVEPSVWGPSLWRSIHYVALGYPDAPTEGDRASYRAFYAGLQRVLPCASCADNYRRHFDTELPIDGYMDNSARLFEWTVKLHNIVNAETGKRQWTMSEAYDVFVTRRFALEDTRGPGMAGTLALATLIALAAVAAYYYYANRKRL